MSQAAGKRGISTMRASGGRLSFVSMGTVGEEGRHSGRERGTKVFPCIRWTASLPAGKRKSGLPSQKSRPLFHALGAQGAGRRTDSSVFSGVWSFRSRCSVIYWGTVPGPFPRNGGRRSRNRPCIPHNDCPRHPEPQDPDGCRACRGQRRRNRPAYP